MNKERMVSISLAVVLAAAAGLYLDIGPRWFGSAGAPATAEADLPQLLAVPQLLPDFAFTDGDGRAVRLPAFRGRMILLNIWATWCTPCRKEMAALDRLQALLGGTDFEVVALSIDNDGLRAVREFYVQTGIQRLRIYTDDAGAAMQNLGVSAIPTTLLIDRHGDVVARKTGPAAWDSPAFVELIRSRLENKAVEPPPR